MGFANHPHGHIGSSFDIFPLQSEHSLFPFSLLSGSRCRLWLRSNILLHKRIDSLDCRHSKFFWVELEEKKIRIVCMDVVWNLGVCHLFQWFRQARLSPKLSDISGRSSLLCKFRTGISRLRAEKWRSVVQRDSRSCYTYFIHRRGHNSFSQ